MKITKTKEEIETYKKELKEICEKAGRVLYCNVAHVSKSGMSRIINVYALIPLTEEEQKRAAHNGITPKVEKYWLSYKVAAVLDYSFSEKPEGIKVGGCGMDMCFSVVYNLGRVLYPNGDEKTIVGRNGDKKPETDGGYLLEYVYIG